MVSERVRPQVKHGVSQVMRCRVPEAARVLAQTAYLQTAVTVDLTLPRSAAVGTNGWHAPEPPDMCGHPRFKHYMETAGIRDFSRAAQPQVRGLPVCGHLWRSPRDTVEPERTHFLSAFTHVSVDHDRGEVHKLYEWLETNRLMGVEHFYVYSYDTSRHGPTELALQPYIDQGIVTFVWYPHTTCNDRDHPEEKYLFSAVNQMTAENSAWRRYGPYTKWMLYTDIDEFIALPRGVDSLRQLAEASEAVDVLSFTPQVFVPCNGTTLTMQSILQTQRSQCNTGSVCWSGGGSMPYAYADRLAGCRVITGDQNQPIAIAIPPPPGPFPFRRQLEDLVPACAGVPHDGALGVREHGGGRARGLASTDHALVSAGEAVGTEGPVAAGGCAAVDAQAG